LVKPSSVGDRKGKKTDGYTGGEPLKGGGEKNDRDQLRVITKKGKKQSTITKTTTPVAQGRSKGGKGKRKPSRANSVGQVFSSERKRGRENEF